LVATSWSAAPGARPGPTTIGDHDDEHEFQQWERKKFPNLPATPAFGTPYQLQDRATQLCLQDVGDNFGVVEAPCQVSPGARSTQLWDNHTASDRTVNGHFYRFTFNRGTTRVLSCAPQFGTTIPVLSSKRASNTGSAAAALQLWKADLAAIG
jgi:hypothetical protein